MFSHRTVSWVTIIRGKLEFSDIPGKVLNFWISWRNRDPPLGQNQSVLSTHCDKKMQMRYDRDRHWNPCCLIGCWTVWHVINQSATDPESYSLDYSVITIYCRCATLLQDSIVVLLTVILKPCSHVTSALVFASYFKLLCSHLAFLFSRQKYKSKRYVWMDLCNYCWLVRQLGRRIGMLDKFSTWCHETFIT